MAVLALNEQATHQCHMEGSPGAERLDTTPLALPVQAVETPKGNTDLLSEEVRKLLACMLQINEETR